MIGNGVSENVMTVDVEIKENEPLIVDVGVADVIYEMVDNYEELNNKPQINNIELTGNKSGEQLGLLSEEGAISIDEIMAICQ